MKTIICDCEHLEITEQDRTKYTIVGTELEHKLKQILKERTMWS